MTKTQQRVRMVLERMLDQVKVDADYAEMYTPQLNEMLSCLICEDCFGTEGQDDPRGDFRNGEWSMDRVEGVDK